ncbi:MAG: hypothetical protein IJG36_01075 [Synergistaceae bacterium]|nr:hypothetical protein [Synergistaceae bacterium]
MPKGNSGIGRGHGVRGLSKMSHEDRKDIEAIQSKIAEENKSIPSFVKEGMSATEIQDEIVSRVRASGQTVAGVSPSIVDASFAEAKDKRFTPLINGLNATRPKGGYSRDEIEDYYLTRAVELTSGYSTRELRSFVTDELGEKVRRGGRREYETKIGMELMYRFTRGVIGGSIRPSLGQPDWEYIDRRVRNITNSMLRRKEYRSRIDEIRVKYRKTK